MSDMSRCHIAIVAYCNPKATTPVVLPPRDVFHIRCSVWFSSLVTWGMTYPRTQTLCFQGLALYLRWMQSLSEQSQALGSEGVWQLDTLCFQCPPAASQPLRSPSEDNSLGKAELMILPFVLSANLTVFCSHRAR